MSENGLENFASVITVLAALGGIFVALAGLNTWRKQIEFSADSDLAKKILVLLYRHFDALSAIRGSQPVTVKIDRPDGIRILSEEESRLRFSAKAGNYLNGFVRVSEIRADIYPLLIEGQAFWGREFKDMFAGLWLLERELDLTVKLFLELSNPDISQDHKQALLPLLTSKRDILFTVSDETDIFAKDYLEELAKIEDVLRKKLGRNRK